MALEQKAQPQRGEIRGLQVLKSICAFFIVCIHVKFGQQDLLKPLLRVAVPIFLMISGYFIVGKDGDIDQERIKKNLLKILMLTISANAVYITFRVVSTYWLPESVPDFFAAPRLVEFVLFGNVFCAALWYLVGYLECLLVVYVLMRMRCLKLLYLFIPVGIFLSLALGKYWAFVSDHEFMIHVSRNFFTVMLPCFGLGMLMRKRPAAMAAIGKPWIVLAGLSLLYLEEWLLMATRPLCKGDIYIMTLPLACALFAWFCNMRVGGKIGFLVGLGRNHSMNIFLYHLLIADSLFLIFGDILADYMAYVVFFLAIAFSFAIRWLKPQAT